MVDFDKILDYLDNVFTNDEKAMVGDFLRFLRVMLAGLRFRISIQGAYRETKCLGS